MNKNDIVTLIRFNYWANERVLATCEQISVDEFTREVTPDPPPERNRRARNRLSGRGDNKRGQRLRPCHCVKRRPPALVCWGYNH
jgi:hypothetical protein